MVRSRRSSDQTLFVRTHVAIFFFCLLICDLFQGIGALLNIPWIVEQRAYIGPVCTAQAAVKQIGNVREVYSLQRGVIIDAFRGSQVGTAIFSFVIAAHTFSLLFLRRQWSSRICYIVLIVSWGVLVFDLCIGNFIVADKRRGAYYGISGYWCWITPAYPVERYTTEYLFMFASAFFSFILYLLVFFRLRGNITLAGGYKVQFHQRPKVRVGRTAAGTYIMTDDRRVESHLTTVAKQMLWYPIAYTVLVLPIAAARFSTFAGVSVPFAVTIFTAAVFMLTGFVNAVLFCLTRNVLPGTWKQRFGLGSTFHSRGPSASVSSRPTNATWRGAAPTRAGTASTGSANTGTVPLVLNVGVEKAVEIRYDEAEYKEAEFKFGAPPSPPSPPSPSSPLRVHDGSGQQADSYGYHIQQRSIPASRYARRSIRIEGDGDTYLSAGAHPTSRVNPTELEELQYRGHASSGLESGMSRLAPGLEAPPSSYPFATTTSANTDTQQPRPSSILIIGNPTHAPWPDSGGNGSGPHWTGYHR